MSQLFPPNAVAEFTVGMILALDRKHHPAHNRVREGNFFIEGPRGFDLHTRNVGIVGTGKIRHLVARILSGFGCRIVAHDPHPNDETLQLGVEYLDFRRLPWGRHHHGAHSLTPETLDLNGLINTSRGVLVDTEAAIDAL